MDIKIALAGNPNCGKTTLFNALTGSNQYVGNWPGVTVEKKEGKLKGYNDVIIQDLPGIYSLSPYTLEEVVARDYLVKERPDAILNVVDGTNIERNLYLTTQLIELGLPVVVAVNMIDLVRKNGDKIDLAKLGKALGCEVVEMSALKGEGGVDAAERAMAQVKAHKAGEHPHVFTGSVEHALAHIEESIQSRVDGSYLRWYAIKVFERDEKVLEELAVDEELRAHLEGHIADCEAELDDDAESIITNQRYDYIGGVVGKAVVKKAAKNSATTSDKIDQVVTDRVLALPIFVGVMFLIYAIAMGPWRISVGARASDWANDGLFGDGWFLPFTADTDAWDEACAAFEEAQAIIAAYGAGEAEAYLYDEDMGETIRLAADAGAYAKALAVAQPDPNDYGTWIPGLPVVVGDALEAIHCDEVVRSLVLDGIVGGVGAVLGFVPQLLVLFLLLAIVEDVGYMSRVAFIMDRLFRRFGLSGKSFIPMLVATGCGVPGVMASRTIDQDRDRKMTIMTTCFIPCSAKMPIIGMFAGALFGRSVWVAVSAYFIGVAAVVVSGIMLKKFRVFTGDAAPFVMELPAYHAPCMKNVLRTTWDRGWSFIKRAGTVILLSTVILWFLQGFGFEGGSFGVVSDNDHSLLASMGRIVAFVFIPLGFGSWQTAVATLTGLIAKEEVVATMKVLYPGDFIANIGATFSGLSAYSFMIFNLLCAPCFAAMGAIKREMNDSRWTWRAIGYMCAFAYAISLIVYQLGGLIAGEVAFSLFTVAAAAVLAGMLYLLFRPAAKPSGTSSKRSAGAARV